MQFINATVRLFAPLKNGEDASLADDMQHSSFAQWQTM